MGLFHKVSALCMEGIPVLYGRAARNRGRARVLPSGSAPTRRRAQLSSFMKFLKFLFKTPSFLRLQSLSLSSATSLFRKAKNPRRHRQKGSRLDATTTLRFSHAPPLNRAEPSVEWPPPVDNTTLHPAPRRVLKLNNVDSPSQSASRFSCCGEEERYVSWTLSAPSIASKSKSVFKYVIFLKASILQPSKTRPGPPYLD